MKLKQIFLITAISSTSAIASVWLYTSYIQKPLVNIQPNGKIPANYAGFFDGKSTNTSIDFTQASQTSVQAVVHIKTKISAQKISNGLPNRQRGNGFFDDLFDPFFEFGPQVMPEQRASGSGVLISDDGYIVTNNHVISDQKGGIAEEITVTLHNKKTFKARLIGKDPSSDLAVLKIDATELPYLVYGNSDNVKLGQWVLAIGYPLTLETTVTAGIVSAKGRTIGINERQMSPTSPESGKISAVESFIQTDAAVNQGNSGGALVNVTGELIGINSAILAPNGTYAGYSFAIPVNIAKKIVNDLIQYGDVKRGYLGISYIPFKEENEKAIKKVGVADGQGVYVENTPSDGAAAQAGIKKGDVILKINNTQVSSGLEMSGQIAQFKPGDKVPVSYVRNGKEFLASVVLKDSPGKQTEIAENNIGEKLGATLENLSKTKATANNLEGGVLVKTIQQGGRLSKTRMEDGFVITGVNGRRITSVEELSKLLSNVYGTVRLEGIYIGYEGTYAYPLNLND